MDEKILEIFRESDEFVSGEELSEKLGITRAAIWKHIESLRADGYNIQAQPHMGYKLVSVPDKMIPEEIAWKLGTHVIGKKIYSYQSTASTMDIATQLANSAAHEGTVVFAEQQTKGRGRLGREWISPKGKGIYVSVILRPKILPQEAPKITLMAAVSVANAIRKITSLEAMIKWPNDIIIGGKPARGGSAYGGKVAGILTEMSAEVDRTKFIIIGIGINVNEKKGDLPDFATSLMEHARHEIPRIEFAKELLRQLDAHYIEFTKKGFKRIIEEWRALSATIGTRVKVMYNNRKIEGEALDVDQTGALLVRLDSGFIEKILTGDVTILR